MRIPSIEFADNPVRFYRQGIYAINSIFIAGRGELAQLNQEEELLFVRHIHLISDRVKNDRQLTVENLHFLRTCLPDLYCILEKITPEEAYEVFDKYKDHPFYSKDIEILWTPKGREIAVNELKMIKENAGLK